MNKHIPKKEHEPCQPHPSMPPAWRKLPEPLRRRFLPDFPADKPPIKPIDLRKRPIYPPEGRFAARGKVTAIAGFRCSEGVILCADSEVNYGGYAKSPENKITLLGNHSESVRAAITGAGDWESVQEVAKHLETWWPDILRGKNFDFVLSQKIMEIHKRSHPNDWGGLTVIAVVWQSGKIARVLRAEDENGVRDIYEFTCDGMGISLGRSIAGSFYQPDIDLREGVSLASYILFMADKYAPMCSGLGNIFTLTDEGSMNFELEWDMEARREFFERLIPELGFVFLHGPDRDTAFQEFEAEMAGFVESLRRLRKQIELDEYGRGKKYGHFD